MVASVLKAIACREIDGLARELVAVSDQIGRSPELGLQEFKAAALLCQLLESRGIAVERETAGMPTAFRAEIQGQARRPRVALLAEYDALPEIGHGCGHNIIGAAAVGATLGLAALSDRLSGSVVLLGTPAEESAVENAGGKIVMLAAGLFDEVDATMMVHPSNEDGAFPLGSLAARSFEFQFHGRAAHAAAAPEKGINALEGVLITFAGINSLRQHLASDARVHGIITHGGTSANVVPAFAACRFRVRAERSAHLEEVVQKVIRCAEAGATASGATMRYREFVPPYFEMVPNRSLSEAANANLEGLGLPLLRQRHAQAREGPSSSTDFGNVSHKTPAVNIRLAIAGPELIGHSKEFAEAALSPRGQAAVLLGAKALAMTALDVLLNPQLAQSAFQEHARAINSRARRSSGKS